MLSNSEEEENNKISTTSKLEEVLAEDNNASSKIPRLSRKGIRKSLEAEGADRCKRNSYKIKFDI